MADRMSFLQGWDPWNGYLCSRRCPTHMGILASVSRLSECKNKRTHEIWGKPWWWGLEGKTWKWPSPITNVWSSGWGFLPISLLHVDPFFWLQLTKVLCMLSQPLQVHMYNCLIAFRRQFPCHLLPQALRIFLLPLLQWLLSLGRRINVYYSSK